MDESPVGFQRWVFCGAHLGVGVLKVGHWICSQDPLLLREKMRVGILSQLYSTLLEWDLW